MSVESDLGRGRAAGTWVGLPDTITMGRDRSTARPEVTPYLPDKTDPVVGRDPAKRGRADLTANGGLNDHTPYLSAMVDVGRERSRHKSEWNVRG